MASPSPALELNFDGLVGPTFNHGGFALGNLASAAHSGHVSHPRQAALQGLAKMRALYELGVPQAILPPHFRPDLNLARRLGFNGSEAEILGRLWDRSLPTLAACYSASSMWTANAATVAPSMDTDDGRLHLTPANLQNQLHRSIEAAATHRIFSHIFSNEARFALHAPLPPSATTGDEGAANHTRLCPRYDAPGLHFFVYGQSVTEPWISKPTVFPARQTRQACETLARLHQLDANRVVFAQQNPKAIDSGVFHNDVISVGDRNLLLCHESAFLEQEETLDVLRKRFVALYDEPLQVVEVSEEALPLEACVATYLFNSQLVQARDQRTVMVCPTECERHAQARALLDGWVASPDIPIDDVHFYEVRESMHGGGGPACLRLRVVLTDEEQSLLPPGLIFSPEGHGELVAWVEKHYRQELKPADLADPKLIEESKTALDELTRLLGIGAIYDFQGAGPGSP